MAFGNNISLGMIIGGAVAASFSSAIGSATSKIGYFKKQAESARGFKSMIGDTIRLREELNKAAGTDAFAKIKEKHDKSIENLKKHGINVKDLQREYDQLGKTVKGLEMVDAGNAKIGDAMQNIKRSGQAIAGVVAATVVPALASASFESIVRDIAIKGGIARTVKEQALSEGILKDAQDSGMSHGELAQAVNTLVAGGMAVEEAASLAKTMARFSISQNAQSEDVAKMILALRQAGISDPALMEKSLGKVAVAGDLGSFESKDMAKHFASLMPQMTMFGFLGERGTAELANMLQTQMKAAGSTDEAANNLANLFSKITSEDTRSKFEKKGFSLQNSMELAISQGLDPVTAFLKLVQKMSSQSDPAKAAQMADLQKQIADAQDPAAAQKMLDGYLEMAGLSEFISDRQAKQAALAVLQNQKLHESNLSLIQAADGEAKIEKDLADRRAASARKWSEAGNAFNRVMIRVGDALSPVTDWFADQIIRIGGAIEELAKESPQAVQALTFAAAAFAAIGAVVGVVKLLLGGLKVLQGLLTLVGGGKIPGGIGDKLNLPGSGKTSIFGGLGKAAGSMLGSVAGKFSGGSIGMGIAALQAGYSIGEVIAPLIDKGLSKMTGENTTLGGWLYDKMHPEQAAAAKAMTAPATQNNTFSPTIQVTVQGDVKDPDHLVNEIMRHLEQKQARSANGAMFDAAYAQ
ncbi:phage tail tape measure protein [Nitrosomonas oligotropha]|uniref:Phage-related minor tail protein n=1 Tax=Nitrosomonas oligotropha TaxID=42354 RepID=A0A1H8TC78_9PROT|nr:phage tail tape measure protein [Nitrosomonas oligotropha]SDX24479.1 Phage-related minor tail protein [Nitrosomonas oligotropha]SEO88512.1 Phage-related minor tail protein [Nitrosomonas oligotropha]